MKLALEPGKTRLTNLLYLVSNLSKPRSALNINGFNWRRHANLQFYKIFAGAWLTGVGLKK